MPDRLRFNLSIDSTESFVLPSYRLYVGCSQVVLKTFPSLQEWKSWMEFGIQRMCSHRLQTPNMWDAASASH